MKLPAVLLSLPLMLPYAASAAAPDPIAYACYFCSAEEMQQKALQQGVGEHYIYDASIKFMVAFAVRNEGTGLTATEFAPAPWVQTQFNAMIRAYDATAGAFVHKLTDVRLLPPGGAHTRSDAYLWGQHTTALNPVHPAARETARRYIEQKLSLPYLRADVEHGRLLRFESADSETPPIVARLAMGGTIIGTVDFFYDRDSGRWEYLRASDAREHIQETAEDFVGPSGRRTFFYSRYHDRLSDYFVERARLAGVRVVGKTPPYNDVGIVCEQHPSEKVCTITY